MKAFNKEEIYARINEKYFEGERVLYGLSNTILEKVTFGEGKSPLKETQNLEIKANIFKYKYPLWYCKQY